MTSPYEHVQGKERARVVVVNKWMLGSLLWYNKWTHLWWIKDDQYKCSKVSSTAQQQINGMAYWSTS